MKSRGDTGQITRAEDAMSEIKEVKTEVADMRNDLKRLMKHLNVPSDPPSSESISRIWIDKISKFVKLRYVVDTNNVVVLF